jgi:hypothetical protein
MALSEGDIVSAMFATSEGFQKMLTVVMKHAIGIAVIEELH